MAKLKRIVASEVNSPEREKCSVKGCKNRSHPLYNGRCENCWVAGQINDSRDVYKDDLIECPLFESVSALGLDLRVTNILENAGVRTIGDVIKRGEAGLLSIKGIAIGTLRKIREELSVMGLTLPKGN